MILLAQILLILIVLGIVLYPLFAHRGERAWMESRRESRLRSIAERKERLYGTIVDLDFDRDAGKLSSEDHARMRDEAMRDVLAVLQEEEALVRGAPAAPGAPAAAPAAGAAPLAAVPSGDDVERMIQEYKKRKRIPTVEVTHS
jgi:cytochrome c-type biogenesis protein CcmI